MVIRSIQGNVVKRQALNQSLEVLKELPAKERENLALREAIFEMLPEIEGVLDRGYSLDEVAGILSHNGVSIKGATLKQYLREGRKKRSRKRSRPSRSRAGMVEKSQRDQESAGSQGLEDEVDRTAGKESEEKGESDKAEIESQAGSSGAKAGGSESGRAAGSVEAKQKRAKGSGRKVGEFTEVPDDL